MTGRVIAAWPLFSLIATYELLMGQVRRAAEVGTSAQRSKRSSRSVADAATAEAGSTSAISHFRERAPANQRKAAGQEVQLDAWR